MVETLRRYVMSADKLHADDTPVPVLTAGPWQDEDRALVDLCSRRIVRKRLGLEASRYQILQILSLTLFEKTPILCALQTTDPDATFTQNVNQLILFEF